MSYFTCPNGNPFVFYSSKQLQGSKVQNQNECRNCKQQCQDKQGGFYSTKQSGWICYQCQREVVFPNENQKVFDIFQNGIRCDDDGKNLCYKNKKECQDKNFGSCLTCLQPFNDKGLFWCTQCKKKICLDCISKQMGIQSESNQDESQDDEKNQELKQYNNIVIFSPRDDDLIVNKKQDQNKNDPNGSIEIKKSALELSQNFLENHFTSSIDQAMKSPKIIEEIEQKKKQQELFKSQKQSEIQNQSGEIKKTALQLSHNFLEDQLTKSIDEAMKSPRVLEDIEKQKQFLKEKKEEQLDQQKISLVQGPFKGRPQIQKKSIQSGTEGSQKSIAESIQQQTKQSYKQMVQEKQRVSIQLEEKRDSRNLEDLEVSAQEDIQRSVHDFLFGLQMKTVSQIEKQKQNSANEINSQKQIEDESKKVSQQKIQIEQLKEFQQNQAQKSNTSQKENNLKNLDTSYPFEPQIQLSQSEIVNNKSNFKDESYQEEISKVSFQVQELENKLREKEQNIKRTQEQLKMKTQDLNLAQIEIEDFKTKENNWIKKQNEWRDEKLKFQNLIKNLEEKNITLQEQVNYLENSKNKKENKNDSEDLERIKSEMRIQKQNYEMKIARIEKDLQIYSDKNQDLEREVEIQRNKITYLRAESDRFQQSQVFHNQRSEKVLELENQIFQLESRIQMINEERMEFMRQSQVEKLSSEQIKGELRKYEIHCSMLKQQLQDNEKRQKQERERTEELKRQFYEMRGAQQVIIQQIEKQLDLQQRQIEEKQSENEKLRLRAKKLETENKIYKQQYQTTASTLIRAKLNEEHDNEEDYNDNYETFIK